MTKYDLVLTDTDFTMDGHGIAQLRGDPTGGSIWLGQSILNAGTGVEYTVVDISDGIVRLAREPKPDRKAILDEMTRQAAEDGLYDE